jgi:hypothetical protein
MAAPNYSFEKRKRDNAKKAAKEAKRLRKLEKGVTSSQIIEQAPPVEESDSAPAEESPPA